MIENAKVHLIVELPNIRSSKFLIRNSEVIDFKNIEGDKFSKYKNKEKLVLTLSKYKTYKTVTGKL